MYFSQYRIIIGTGVDSSWSKREAVFDDSTCDTDNLYNYTIATQLNLPCYITAEINGDLVADEGFTFNVGDGKTFGNYYNAPLEPYKEYSLAIQIIVDAGVRNKMLFKGIGITCFGNLMAELLS